MENLLKTPPRSGKATVFLDQISMNMITNNYLIGRPLGKIPWKLPHTNPQNSPSLRNWKKKSKLLTLLMDNRFFISRYTTTKNYNKKHLIYLLSFLRTTFFLIFLFLLIFPHSVFFRRKASLETFPWNLLNMKISTNFLDIVSVNVRSNT